MAHGYAPQGHPYVGVASERDANGRRMAGHNLCQELRAGRVAAGTYGIRDASGTTVLGALCGVDDVRPGDLASRDR